MENRINVVEILKNCQQGMELDCRMFENLEFDHIDKDNGAYPIICRVKTKDGYYNTESFTEYGCYGLEKYSKCVIFPKGKTTWEGFVQPCQFKDGDILCNSKTKQPFILKFFDLLNNNIHSYCGIDGSNKFYTSSNNWAYASDVRLATEEERQKLFDAIKANGYKWNAETKTLEKLTEPKFKVGDKVRHKSYTRERNIVTEIKDTHYILDDELALPFISQDDYELVSNKFDISTLKPFESKVLVRTVDNQFWRPAIWGVKHLDWDFCCVLGGEMWEQCIPYEGNEHLLGKTDDCDEYYKTWK